MGTITLETGERPIGNVTVDGGFSLGDFEAAVTVGFGALQEAGEFLVHNLLRRLVDGNDDIFEVFGSERR